MLRYDFSLAFKETLEVGLSFDDVLSSANDALKSLNSVLESEAGFIRILKTDEYIEEVEGIKDWLKNFDSLVVLGIGGSALGNLALHTSLKSLDWNNLSSEKRNGGLKVFVVDNVDPEFVASVMNQIDPKKTLFNVISKSGTTAEAMSNYLIARGMLNKADLEPKDHLLFTTDPENGVLRKIADTEGIKTLTIPPDVGGRFSVLTPVGLLSALAEDIDIRKLLYGARQGLERYSRQDVKSNPLIINALLHYLYSKKGYNISVMMPYSNRLYLLADWYRQLWAESLGKKFDLSGRIVRTGQTPVKALGAVDQHSQVQLYNEGPKDKIVTFLRTENFTSDLEIPRVHSDIEALSYLEGKKLGTLLNSEQRGTSMALADHGVPNITISFPEINEVSVGEFIAFYELLTAVMGGLLRINPYDQPGVELGKKITYGLMGRNGYSEVKERYEEKTSWRLEL